MYKSDITQSLQAILSVVSNLTSTINDKITEWNGRQSTTSARIEKNIDEGLKRLEKRIGQLEAAQRETTIVATDIAPLEALGLVIARLDNIVNDDSASISNASIRMIFEEASEMACRLGLEEIPGVGEEFSPVWHELAGKQPGPSSEQGKVIQVVRKGYRKKGSVNAVLKAWVIVCSNS